MVRLNKLLVSHYFVLHIRYVGARPYSVPGWWRRPWRSKIAKIFFFKKKVLIHSFKSSIIGVFLHALQVYLRPQAWFRMTFLTYLTKIIFSLKSIYSIFGNDLQRRFFQSSICKVKNDIQNLLLASK